MLPLPRSEYSGAGFQRGQSVGGPLLPQHPPVPEGSRMYLEAGNLMRGNPGARQPSSASVYSTSNASRNSLAARLDPSA